MKFSKENSQNYWVFQFWYYFQFKIILAASKKIINPNLSKEQKIMFKKYRKAIFKRIVKRKRKGFYHCANCGNKLFASTAKYNSGTGWPLLLKLYPGL